MIKLNKELSSSRGSAERRSLESASRLHQYCPELDDAELSYALDDTSCASLDLDQVFRQIDCSLFFAGSQYLYARMRRPWLDGQKISEIQQGLKRLSSNHRLREGMEREFRRLCALPGKQVAALLWGEVQPSPLPRWLLIALPLALFASVVLALVVQAKFWLLAMPLFALLCYVHHYLQLRTSAFTDALLSLRHMTRARQRMRKLEDLDALSDPLECDRALAKLLRLRACMGNQDKLSEGVSFYLSELKSLEDFVRASKSDNAWIFILDEIFRGTNGDERIAASVAVLEHLSQRHCVLAATHDQAMLDHLGPHFLHKSFSGQPCDEKGLRFDFRLREGPCFDRNALRLMQHLQFPQALVERAESLVCPAKNQPSSAPTAKAIEAQAEEKIG